MRFPLGAGAACLTMVLLQPACDPADRLDLIQRPACQNTYSQANDGDRFIIVSLPTASSPEGLTLEVFYPSLGPLLPDGAPAVVVIHGGFDTDVVPVEARERVLLNGQGIIQVYLNLPGGSTDWSSGGVASFRGADARQAVADALSYATGESADIDGCTLEDRLPVPLSSLAPILYGHSNGGNLAVATLADPDLSTDISGLLAFETPASAQFITVEVGSVEHPLPQYLADCSWSGGDGLVCTMDYSSLRWRPLEDDPSYFYGAFFDQDDDGKYRSEIDYAVWGIRLEAEIIYSPQLAGALESAGYADQDMMTSTSAQLFWEERDASRQVDAALRLHRDLKAIVIGTETDHTLGIPDHAHITGLASALRKSGADWVRVNPDACYVESLLYQDAEFADNKANYGFFPGDPGAVMEPEETEQDEVIDDRFYSTAAVTELFERSWSNRWDENLSSRLWP